MNGIKCVRLSNASPCNFVLISHTIHEAHEWIFTACICPPFVIAIVFTNVVSCANIIKSRLWQLNIRLVIGFFQYSLCGKQFTYHWSMMYLVWSQVCNWLLEWMWDFPYTTTILFNPRALSCYTITSIEATSTKLNSWLNGVSSWSYVSSVTWPISPSIAQWRSNEVNNLLNR